MLKQVQHDIFVKAWRLTWHNLGRDDKGCYTLSMLWLIFFLLEFLVLFFLSQLLTKTLSGWMLQKTRNEKMTVSLLSFLFLPGVIVHELSHWLLANLLFVRTGEIEFLPQIREDTVKLGSVAVAKTDIFRRFLIGAAPVIFGVTTIVLLVYFLLPEGINFSWQSLVVFYALFEVSNTMFSSSKDMEGALALLGGMVVFALAFYFLGFRVDLSFLLTKLPLEMITNLVRRVVMVFLFPIVINLLVYFFLLFLQSKD